jgi:hypothetical protein
MSNTRYDADDDDSDDDSSETGTWIVVDRAVTDLNGRQNMQYFWKTRPGESVSDEMPKKKFAIFIPKSESAQEREEHVKKRKNLELDRIFFLSWGEYTVSRCKSAKVQNLLPSFRQLDARNLQGELERILRGKLDPTELGNPPRNKDGIPLQPYPGDSNGNFSRYFDEKFAEGQDYGSAVAHELLMQHNKVWTVETDQEWDKTISGEYTKTDEQKKSTRDLVDRSPIDTRVYEKVKTGHAFLLASQQAMPVPSRTETYLRLSWVTRNRVNGAAADLLTYDKEALGRGLSRKDYYIPESTMNQLLDGSYHWQARMGLVAIRTDTGAPNYIWVTDGSGG